MKNSISIIIPILNEVDYIGRLLKHLLDNSSTGNIAEIIVVDGGSIDGSKEVVSTLVTSSDSESHSELYREANTEVLDSSAERSRSAKFSIDNFTRTNIRLINSAKGRAKQMNLGAKNASGHILYFLHADSLPPKDFDQLIINEVENDNEAGCFRMQFNSNHWWLRLASWLTQFRWRACRGGDQSQFITKDLFNEIGGYDESYIIYEDNILINELYARNEFVVINKKLKTSARCYKRNGIWRLQYHFWTIYVKKWFGASAEELHAYYKRHVR